MSRSPKDNSTVITRRKLFAALAASPFAAAYGHNGILKVMDMMFGTSVAYAAPATSPVKYFIEINLRDQWDFMHFAVPPGLATKSNLIRAEQGTTGEERLCSLFHSPSTLIKGPNNFYLTDDSKEILPHLGDIAMIETIELPIGTVHGHEASNGMRSPGRNFSSGEGRKAMWLSDDANQTDFAGDEKFYSSSPTPGLVHLNLSKITNPSTRAVALKFLGRGDKKHSVYHFAGNLSDNGLVRVQSRELLLQQFTPAKNDNILTKSETELVASYLKKLDDSYLQRLKYTQESNSGHKVHQDSFLQRLTASASALNLNLTAAEKAYWSKDVPPEMSGAPRMHLWEQSAMASKLLSAGAVSSVSMEFSFDDQHGPRPKAMLVAQGKIVGMVLARLIADLKSKGMWNDTLIFINSTDGGRTPESDSTGDRGKNTMILAGGGIQGGYYGDIKVASTSGNVHNYSYHRPDSQTGLAVAAGTTGNDGRVPNAVAYRTILNAMGAPSSSYSSLPDVKDGEWMKFVLKNS